MTSCASSRFPGPAEQLLELVDEEAEGRLACQCGLDVRLGDAPRASRSCQAVAGSPAAPGSGPTASARAAERLRKGPPAGRAMAVRHGTPLAAWSSDSQGSTPARPARTCRSLRRRGPHQMLPGQEADHLVDHRLAAEEDRPFVGVERPQPGIGLGRQIGRDVCAGGGEGSHGAAGRGRSSWATWAGQSSPVRRGTRNRSASGSGPPIRSTIAQGRRRRVV